MTSSDFMNELLRGNVGNRLALQSQEPETDGEQEQQEGEPTPQEVAASVAGKADGGAGRHGQPDLSEADFLRQAWVEHRGL